MLTHITAVPRNCKMGNNPSEILKQPDLQDIFSQLLLRCVEWRANQKSMCPLEWARKASVVGYVI